MRPRIVTRRRLAAALLAGLAALATPGSARAAFVADSTASLVQTSSTSGLGSFTGTLSVDNVSSTQAYIQVTLTNTSSPANGGYITGFAFNLPGQIASATLTPNPTGSFYLAGGGTFSNTIGDYDDVPGQPYGYFDIGAGLGTDGSLNQGSPNGGLSTKSGSNTGTFTFSVTSTAGGYDLNQLTAQLLLSLSSANPQGGGAQAFLVRFRGFKNGGSDKVVIGPTPTPPTPPPSGVPAPAGLVLALAGFGTCLLGRGFRRRIVRDQNA